MRINRQNKIIVGIITLVLALTVGYAIFTESLNVGGTASASGDFNIIFESIGTIKKEGYTDVTGNNGSNIAIINEGEKKKILDVTIDKLDYPGAYVEIPVVISNEGNIDALLESMVVTKEDGTKEEGTNVINLNDVELRYEIKQKEGETTEISKVIRSKEKKDMLIKVTWLDKEEQIEKAMEISFRIELNYKQYTGELAGGGTGSEEDTSWMYKVNETGEVTAYNYEYGKDVKVPAEVNGVPVKTITKNSFLPKSNLDLYQSQDDKMYLVIHEDEPNYTSVKEKLITILSGDCGSDTACLEGMKSMVYFCKDENTCYNLKEEESRAATKVAIPEGAQSGGSMIVNPDPSVGLEESLQEPKASISTLDLSEATSLESIEEESFYDAGITSVTFGENSKLQTIGSRAFSGNKISSLSLPQSVTTIGGFAFSNNQISSLDLSKSTSLTTIESNAFYGNQINNLTIPKTVATIGEYAFSNNQISSLDLNNAISLTTVGNSAFYNNQIGSLTIPSSVTAIGDYAFQSNQLSSLVIPKTVTTVGGSAFSNNPIENLSVGKCTTELCSNNSFGDQVTTLTVESGEIGSYAFRPNDDSKPKVKNLTLGEGVTSIGEYAFSGNQISNLAIPSSVTTIGNDAFNGSQISNLDLSSATSLTIIGGSAFQNNQISGEIVIPASVTTIENWAFGINQINSLTIPSSITTLGDSIFTDNPIKTLVIGKCVTSMNNSMFGNQVENLTIQSGEIGEAAFQPNSSTAMIKKLAIGEGVTSIGDSAFSYNQISSLTIPSSVTSIGSGAFSDNQISGELVIPLSVTTIGIGAFGGNQISSLDLSGATNLTTIGNNAFVLNQISGKLVIPSNVISIGQGAFNDNQISSLDLSRATSLTTIEGYAFYENQISTELVIPSSVTTINDYAFYKNPIENLSIEKCTTELCNNNIRNVFENYVTTLTVKSGEIGDSAFQFNGSSKIKNLSLGEGVTSIGKSAFRYNQISGELVIPSSVTTIGYYAFQQNQISSLDLSRATSLTTIDNDAFNGNQISSLDLSGATSLTTIELQAFKNNQISSLSLPTGITTIGGSAFSNNQLSSVTIPLGVKIICTYAFSDNPLSSILIKRTEEDFLANVTVGDSWYDGSPTITYQP